MFVHCKSLAGKITFFKTSIKVKCNLHRKCEIFRSSKAFPVNCGPRIAAWLYAGSQRLPEQTQAEEHKQMFQAVRAEV